MLFKESGYQASAPGSLMLLGEYAVLENKPAVVCAVNKRMRVRILPRMDDTVTILSEGYGRFTTSLQALAVTAPFQFVSACLYFHRKKLKSGCDIYICSEFSDQIGFGSSAAVTVATLAALFTWLKIPRSPLQLLRAARHVIRAVQTVGSGADVAAAVTGGVLAYYPTPLAVEKFSLLPALTVVYSGSKTPTVEAIRRVRERFALAPELFKSLCQAIHCCAMDGIAALQAADWRRLGAVMDVQQGLMQALGVSTPLLDALIEKLRANAAIVGAKISGSGWGDCVLGLGQAELMNVGEGQANGARQVAVEVTSEGVRVE